MIDKFVGFLKNYNCDFDYILDVGSGWGLQSEEFADAFPKKQIFAFECNPDSILECKKNIKSKNIKLIETGIWSEATIIPFYPVKNGNVGASSAFKATEEFNTTTELLLQPEEIFIKTITLDFFIEKNNLQDKKGILWMDLQGAELKALTGFQKYLKNILAIWTEAEYKNIYHEQDLFIDIKKFLENKNFKLIYPNDNDIQNNINAGIFFEDFCFINVI